MHIERKRTAREPKGERPLGKIKSEVTGSVEQGTIKKVLGGGVRVHRQRLCLGNVVKKIGTVRWDVEKRGEWDTEGVRGRKKSVKAITLTYFANETKVKTCGD